MAGLIMQISAGVVLASAATLIPFILVELTWQNFWATVLGNGLGLTGSLVAMIWARQGRVRQASWMIILILMVAVTLSGLFFGLTLFPMPTYILFVAMSGLLLGPRGALYTGVISLLAIVLVLYVNIIGLFAPPALPERIAADALTTMMLIVLTTWLIYIIVQHLHQALNRSRQAEAEVRNLNANLETLVAERTGELRRTTRLLQALMDNAPMPIFIKTVSDWRYQLVNRQYQIFRGRTPAEIVNHTDYDFYPSAAADEIRITDEVVTERKKPITVEIDLPDADGTSHTLLSTRFPILDDENRAIAVGGISIDITERKQVEQRVAQINLDLEQRVLDRTIEFQKVNDFLSALVETSIKINQDLEINEVLDHILEQARKLIPCRGINLMLVQDGHAYVARRIGYEGNDSLERDLTDTKYPLTWQTFDRMIEDGSGVVISDTHTDPKWHASTSSWIRSFLGIPLKDIQGKTIGFLNAAHDAPGFFAQNHLTILEALASHAAIALQNARLLDDLKTALKKEKEAQAQLIQTERLALAGRLLATVSHELNNPIQAIQNTLYLLQDETGISEQGREDLSILLAESDRMAALIERLRSIYRPVRSEELFPLQLNELIEDIQLLTAAQFRHKNIKFQSNLDPTLPRIMGNPDQLKQVILNLAMNALDATPTGGLITLQTHATENGIEFSIKDTGTGIAPEVLPHIFNAFVTGKNTGTGLGLTIVHDIIKRHHGHAAAVNAPEGGALFTFWIPTQAGGD